MLLSSADIIFLLSADSDFESTIQYLKSQGKNVLLATPVGSKSSHLQQAVGRENIIFLDKPFFDKYVK